MALKALVARIAAVRYGDKVLHCLGGAVMGFGFSLVMPEWLAWGLGQGIGIAKELRDGKHPEKHTKDIWDFFWTSFGVTAGLLLRRHLSGL